MWAARWGQYETVEMLLNYCANINMFSDSAINISLSPVRGRSNIRSIALMYAAVNGMSEYDKGQFYSDEFSQETSLGRYL